MCPLGVSSRLSGCAAMLKEIVITEQPACARVPKDFPITLCCRAQGPPSLHYQWLQLSESYKGTPTHFCTTEKAPYEEIPGANKPDLHIVAKQTHLYICRVNDEHHKTLYSRWAKVKVLKDVPRGLVPPGWEGDPIIVTQPASAEVMSQCPVQFQCHALGIPAPQYQWYHNGLPTKKSRLIQIKAVKPGDCGSYLCCVSNVRGERWSAPVDLTIGQDIILQALPTVKRPKETYFAVGKVALLIGNNGYLNHPNLLAPMVDVSELSVLLRKIGFCVVSLVDLTREEMLRAVNQFLDLLDKGVYGLFYYAGHGYERSGRNYMVPVDAPQPYRPENCISVQKILQQMQDRKTALNVVLLDTCRKWYNSDCALSKVTPQKPLGNTVYGYATSENAEAYEVQDGDFSSGIFMTYLKKHIMDDKKVTHMLEAVLEDIGDDPLVKGKQVMEIRHTLKESRSLTDKVCPSRNMRLNSMEWEQHRNLPRQKVKFSCGVEAELRFQPVFSNLIHAFAKLTYTPAHLKDMRVHLYNPDMAEHSLTNCTKLDRDDSILAFGSDGEKADSMLRLSGLQKLQNDVIIKIDLHYTNLTSGMHAQDTLDHRIPTTWVARFCNKDTAFMNNDHELGTTNGCCLPRTQCSPTTNCSDNKLGANHPGNASGMPISVQSKSSSEPEENDERHFS
ncbi:mucosa-associated lymphoid tissue lymphoma translocation 1-like isoform X1 [Pelobates cultripes]|uniref:Mucosa-associated lymphoid tissue lymphoma translocation 1-like isoform X1 n=2 Tax=Pelobates cultripes TaxID=61616 RepID=A0AAD1RKI0_PELCU|nr:mucosa-associated lymphoid tissue lymphoma translocation 1-like isoform X1 [Pelobates cultripes]